MNNVLTPEKFQHFRVAPRLLATFLFFAALRMSKAARINKKPRHKGRGFLFSIANFLIVVAVAVLFLDHDHVIAVAIATPTMIAIIVTILHSNAWYADSNFLGANRTVFADDRNAHECGGNE
jgi:hypothetical protein